MREAVDQLWRAGDPSQQIVNIFTKFVNFFIEHERGGGLKKRILPNFYKEMFVEREWEGC